MNNNNEEIAEHLMKVDSSVKNTDAQHFYHIILQLLGLGAEHYSVQCTFHQVL